MRGVQLAMLHDPRWSHPYYWASFIVSGDDRRLDENVQPPDLRVHPGGACACRQGGAPPAGNASFFTAVAMLALGLTRLHARRGVGGSPREAAEGGRSRLRPSAAAIP